MRSKTSHRARAGPGPADRFREGARTKLVQAARLPRRQAEATFEDGSFVAGREQPALRANSGQMGSIGRQIRSAPSPDAPRACPGRGLSCASRAGPTCVGGGLGRGVARMATRVRQSRDPQPLPTTSRACPTCALKRETRAGPGFVGRGAHRVRCMFCIKSNGMRSRPGPPRAMHSCRACAGPRRGSHRALRAARARCRHRDKAPAPPHPPAR